MIPTHSHLRSHQATLWEAPPGEGRWDQPEDPVGSGALSVCVGGEQLTSTLFPHLETWTGAVCRPDLEGKETHCAPWLSPRRWETGGAGVTCGRATNSIRRLGAECHTDKLDAMYLPPAPTRHPWRALCCCRGGVATGGSVCAHLPFAELRVPSH